MPIKPQRVYQEMNRVFGRDTRYVSNIGLSQIAGAQFLHVYQPRGWIDAGQAGPLGWTVPAAVVGIEGRESELIRKVIWWSLGLLLGICVLVYLQSTPILGWMVVGG